MEQKRHASYLLVQLVFCLLLAIMHQFYFFLTYHPSLRHSTPSVECLLTNNISKTPVPITHYAHFVQGEKLGSPITYST